MAVRFPNTFLERFLDNLFLKYYCFIHQEALCGKIWNSQQCVNKNRKRELNRRELCELCDTDIIIYRSQGSADHVWVPLFRRTCSRNILETEKYCTRFSRRERWTAWGKSSLKMKKIDLVYLDYITGHFNDIKFKTLGQWLMFSCLVNDISGFKLKLKLCTSQWKKHLIWDSS